MKKISMIFIALITITFNVLAQSDVSKARWKSKEIVIDGNDHEWTKPLNLYDGKTGLLFAICNDNQYLYLDFSCNDEKKMRKIMSAGWSVELSSKEKSKKFNATIIFPGIKKMALGIRPGSRFEKKVDANLMVKAYLSDLIVLATKGFQSKRDELMLNDKQGVNIAFGADSLQNMVCEIAVPFKELLNENSILPEEPITLNVAVNELERPSIGGGQPGGSGGRPEGGVSGMGGGRSGGGRSGGGRGNMVSRPGGSTPDGGSYSGNGSGDRSSLFEKVSFKQKFTLAKN